MADKIRVTKDKWVHVCLEVPGKPGVATPLNIEGMRQCIYCKRSRDDEAKNSGG